MLLTFTFQIGWWLRIRACYSISDFISGPRGASGPERALVPHVVQRGFRSQWASMGGQRLSSCFSSWSGSHVNVHFMYNRYGGPNDAIHQERSARCAVIPVRSSAPSICINHSAPFMLSNSVWSLLLQQLREVQQSGGFLDSFLKLY
jgi:hypothetical protein